MPHNPLHVDPTRTTTLRNRFLRQMNKRFRNLRGEIRNLIVDLDVFGLKGRRVNAPIVGNVEARAWQFATDAEKIERFRDWLQERIDAGLLSVDSNTGEPWTEDFVHSSYRQGVVRAHTDARAVALAAGDIDEDDFFGSGQNAFLNQAFAAPETTSKLRLISTRTFENLKGITQSMSADLQRILADGLAAGLNPLDIAKEINNRVSVINITRARTLARTEIIHAHAEGQLDSFERLGIQEVGILAEWQTAGDDRVCPMCSSMEGVVLKIKEARAMIPRHPNCRCAWIPADQDVKESGQKTSPRQIRSAIRSSIARERPNLSPEESRRRSVWIGKVKKIDTRR